MGPSDTPATEIEYFLVINGQKRGPFPLGGLIDAGMEHETPVWWQGLESWPLAGKIPKLAALLKEERRRRLAERRAERLPDPGPIRRLGWISLLTNAPMAALLFLSSTALWTSFVLGIVADNSGGLPAPQPDLALVRTAWWLLVGGIAGTVLGLPLLIVEAVCIGRLVWQCRAVVRTAVPSRREEKNLDLVGDLTELGNVEMGGPSLPTPDIQDLVLLLRPRPGVNGMPLVFTGIALIFGTLVLMVGPLAFCLLRPQMIGHVIIFVVAMVVYAVIHIPMVVTMLMTMYRTGYGLNHIIDLYRLKTPWAPIAVGFWTALCGLLMMAGPLSLVLFIFLAIWTRRTSEAAARICDQDSRDIIAVPLPVKAPAASKAAPDFEMA